MQRPRRSPQDLQTSVIELTAFGAIAHKAAFQFQPPCPRVVPGDGVLEPGFQAANGGVDVAMAAVDARNDCSWIGGVLRRLVDEVSVAACHGESGEVLDGIDPAFGVCLLQLRQQRQRCVMLSKRSMGVCAPQCRRLHDLGKRAMAQRFQLGQPL